MKHIPIEIPSGTFFVEYFFWVVSFAVPRIILRLPQKEKYPIVSNAHFEFSIHVLANEMSYGVTSKLPLSLTPVVEEDSIQSMYMFHPFLNRTAWNGSSDIRISTFYIIVSF